MNRCTIKFLDKISRKLGFTEIESKIIFFLLTALLFGIIINVIKDKSENKNLLEFDYSREDSLFMVSGSIAEKEDDLEKITEKSVDSKLELLDFRTGKNVENKGKNFSSTVRKIDINSGTLKDFASLPGIGIKIAQNIIDYRKKIGKFQNIEQILNVKGIGKAKFDKLKNYITIK